jgi:hypothetical protein
MTHSSHPTGDMPQTYTQEELFAFEAARHCLRWLRDILADVMLDEEEKSAPDQVRLSEMRTELSRVKKRLRNLKVGDREDIALIHEQYRELFGRGIAGEP